MSRKLTESQVTKIWQELVPGRSDLVTEDGGSVRVVYPGRPNDDRGADLRDAVITTGGDIRRGDIEIHVNSSSWWGHRHHKDPLYNRVILHVVYRHDVTKQTVLQSGRKVPTLALEKYTGDRVGGYAGTGPRMMARSMPCRDVLSHRGVDFPGIVLDAAGDLRFTARMAEFRAMLLGVGVDQSLYQGIMGALGYTKNKNAMMELARRVPLGRLLALASRETSDEAYLVRSQALLTGMAGLLPSQRAGYQWWDDGVDGWVSRLEEAWANCGETTTMSAADWSFFRIRPGNLPMRRIAAMSCLLLRYRDEGLLGGLIQELEQIVPDDSKGQLEGALLVTAEDFWGSHLDFGMPVRRVAPALLGVNRAGVIVVNVLLPLAFARGQTEGLPELSRKALEVYRRYPAIAGNTLERHMSRQLKINRYLVNSARRQQGLIHIYKTYCDEGKCGECPLVYSVA
jgi:hypothetical protein